MEEEEEEDGEEEKEEDKWFTHWANLEASRDDSSMNLN